LERGGVLACSTTNYTDVAAKALGMDSASLRLALASGKTLTDIASSKQVSLQTAQDALKEAYSADLDQALKDGLIAQAQYDQLKSQMNQASSATPATPQAGQGRNQAGPRALGFGDRFLGVSAHNEVQSFVVAAKAIGVTCPDLVKATQSGQSVAQVATTKNVQAQAVIDALVTAEKAAVAQDVKDGLITQAQADGRTADLTTRVTAFVNNTFQRGNGNSGQGGHGGNQPNGTQGGVQPNNPPHRGGSNGGQGNPAQTATPSANQS
jgi:competence protein ComGC